MRAWLRDLDTNDTPLVVGTVVLPVRLLNNAVGQLECIGKSNWKLLLTVLVTFPSFYMLVIFHPYDKILYAVELTMSGASCVLAVFDRPLAVWSLLLFYLVSLAFWKKEVGESHFFTMVNQVSAVFVWIVVVCHCITLTGCWRIPVVVFLLALMGLGYAKSTKEKNQEEVTSDSSEGSIPSAMRYQRMRAQRQSVVKSLVDNTLTAVGIKENVAKKSILKRSATLSESTMASERVSDQSFSTSSSLGTRLRSRTTSGGIDHSKTIKFDTPSMSSPSAFSSQSSDEDSDIFSSEPPTRSEQLNQSNPYFIALFWLFALTFFWRHMKLCVLAIVLLLLLKHGLARLTFTYFQRIYEENRQLIIPNVCKNIFSLLHAGDKKLLNSIFGVLDQATSIMMIICLVLSVCVLGALFVVLVQKESSYIVTATTNLANKTFASNQDIMQWLNNSTIFTTVDDTIHSGYVMARGQTASYISSMITSENTSHVEHQVIELIDQLYHAWVGHPETTGSDQSHNTSAHHLVYSTVNDSSANSTVWMRLQRLVTGSDVKKLVLAINANIDTLYSIFNSVYSIVQGNMSLMVSIGTQVASILFTSGSFILNSLLSCVVFLTTLLYLLNSSSNEYLIKHWLSSVSMGTRFGDSISTAIHDVFGASLKMATFYFFFTWLTHDTLGANLVFIPAALAAALGVMPFVGTYWAAVPAALELWLVQEEGVLGISLVVLHIIPTYVVDLAIYSEIGEGGHPYLTCLAVAGGVYWFGLEGAFIGPFVLCCLMVAFDIYDGIMNPKNQRRYSIF